MLSVVALLVGAAAMGVAAKPMHYKEFGKPDLNQTVTYDDDAMDAVNNGTLTAFNQAEAYRFLLYSYAAYLTGSLNPWTCTYCKYTSAVSTFQTKTTVYDSGTDAFGYVGYNPQFNEIIIAFRGSSSLQNWILNIQIYKSQTPFGGGSGSVASGFYQFWQALRPQVVPALQALVKQYPSAAIYTTGHSLGAAASSLAAADLITNYGYRSISVRNFGEPRAGDSNYANFANSRVGQYMRMTHNDDIVVHLPPSMFGFSHETTEVWQTSSGYKVCSASNGEDGSCSNSVAFYEYSISDHLSYMGVSCCKGPTSAITLPEHLTLSDRGLKKELYEP